jgi:hypothetical protein
VSSFARRKSSISCASFTPRSATSDLGRQALDEDVSERGLDRDALDAPPRELGRERLLEVLVLLPRDDRAARASRAVDRESCARFLERGRDPEVFTRRGDDESEEALRVSPRDAREIRHRGAALHQQRIGIAGREYFSEACAASAALVFADRRGARALIGEIREDIGARCVGVLLCGIAVSVRGARRGAA